MMAKQPVGLACEMLTQRTPTAAAGPATGYGPRPETNASTYKHASETVKQVNNCSINICQLRDTCEMKQKKKLFH